MKTLLLASLTAALALTMGCQKSEPAPAPAPVTATTTAPAEAATAVEAADVPTPEDYEAKAEKTIAPTATPGVLTTELDKLEKEIGQ
jgi:nitrous oxide reductase accessory protein NosL